MDNNMSVLEIQENRSKKKKERIKSFAIVFLSIMLVLTFFSNTIMNYSLPEVGTQYVQADTVTAKIRGTATVEVADPYLIKIKESRVISSVAVKDGDNVTKDQVLFVLEDKDSKELTEAIKLLDAAILEYETAILSGDISADVFNNVQAGKTESLGVYQSRIIDADNQIKAATATLEAATANATAIQKQIDVAGNKVVTTVDEENAVTAATAAVAAAEAHSAVIAANLLILEGLGSIGENPVGDPVLHLANCEAGFRAEYINFYNSAYVQALAPDKKPLDPKIGDPSGEETTANLLNSFSNIAEDVLTGIYADTNALEAYNKAKSKYSDWVLAKEEYNKAATLVSVGSKPWPELLADYKNIANSAKAEIATKQAALAQANANLLAVKNARTDANNKAELNNKLIDANLAKTNAEALLKKVTEAKTQVVKDIAATLKLSGQSESIDKLEDEIKKLKEKAIGATIVCPYDGVIMGIVKKAGETAEVDETLATLRIEGKDMLASFAVTKEQAAKLSVGDMAELQNMWNVSSPVELKLTNIKPDTTDSNKKKLLVFSVKGEVDPGQSLNISVSEKSANYDLVVPNSAIREDNKGKFVLVVTSKSSPLGNRYIAERVDVEVLASDDIKTAISGVLFGYQYVITTSNKPVEAGKQVRLTEE